MTDKKQIKEEELDDVTGGSCSGDLEDSSVECPNCKSHNNTYYICMYNDHRYTCSDCNTKWTMDDNGNIFDIELG